MGGDLVTSAGHSQSPSSAAAEGGLDHSSDDASGEDYREASERVDHRGLPGLHLAWVTGGRHVHEGAPHEEKGGDSDADTDADVEQAGEESVDLLHVGHSTGWEACSNLTHSARRSLAGCRLADPAA